MKKTFLNNFFICFLIFLLLSLDFIKVFAQTSQSIYIAPNKTNFVLGDKVCIGISDLPGAESGTSTKIKLYTDGPNSECKDGCEQDLLFIRSPFGNNALCMTPTDKDEVGSWNAYIEYNGIKSNTINYQIADKEEVTNQISNNEITQKFQSYLKANGFDDNITVYPGNTINYTFWSNVTGSDDFTIESWYTSDTPDNCPGGITRPGEVKPWILSGRFASTGGTSSVQDCQAGKTYKITVVLRDRQGNIVGGDTLNVSVRSPSERTINPSFCDAIQSGNTYTLDQITRLIRPAYEEQYYSCTLQRNSGDIKYYVPDGNPSSVPPGNAYYADWNYTEISPDGKSLITKKIPKGIILCSYDNPLTATLSNAPLSLDFCDLGGPFKSRTDYCLKNDMGADDFAQKNIQALKQEIQSSCSKSVNIVLGSSQNVGFDIGSNLNNSATPNFSTTGQGLFANGQKNISVYVGDVINYTWRGPDGVGYTYSSNYIADAPDNCPGGIQTQGEIKPWVANTKQGSKSDQVQQCQAGRTYTISYLAFNSAGSIVYKDSIIVRVLLGQRPGSQTSTLKLSRPELFDVSFYNPTPMPKNPNIEFSKTETYQSNSGTQQNQLQLEQSTTPTTNNVLNSLVDAINQINLILENAKKLNPQQQSVIVSSLQPTIQSLQNLIANLISQNSSVSNPNIASSAPNQNINTSPVEYKEVTGPKLDKQELIKLAQEKTYEEMVNLFGNGIEKFFIDNIKPEDIPTNFKNDSFFAYFLGLNQNPSEGKISGKFVFRQSEWLIAPTENTYNQTQNTQLQNSENYVVGLWVEKEFFDLKTEDNVSTRVRVWYLKDNQNFDQDSNVKVSIDNDTVAKVDLDKQKGVITIKALNPGQTTINVHPELTSDYSKDKKIKIRVFDKNVKINSFVLSDSILNMYANSPQKISGLVYLSDGSISPAFKVFSDKPNFVGVDFDANGEIIISASNMPTNTSNLSYQLGGDYSSYSPYQSYTATLIIRPLFAGDDTSFDKIVTLNVEPQQDYLLPVPAPEPKLPLYIFELSSNRRIGELSSTQIDELNNYFANNLGVLPSYFIPDSWMAWQLNLGNEIPTSENGLPLQAIIFGYQYQDGKYVNVFRVPNSNAVGLKIKDSANAIDHISSVYDTISKTSSYANRAESLINQIGKELYLPSLQYIAYKAFQYTARFAAFIAPVGFVITGLEVINWLNNYFRIKHYKEDDTRIANDMMQKITLVVDTYNSNRAPDADKEKKYHDALVMLVNNLFYASAPYFKLERSWDSQRAYVDSFIKTMDDTLARRLSAF